ncbi:MAG: TIGR02300 family protein [Alphaproteobacteria bacterium]|nr:MAG: TIGR02300 family protein [Alphaproteobacteria bacterium]
MVKPEWGAKRVCHSCGAAFYDMRRSPIICPKCGAEYDPEAILKSRRSRAPAAEEKAPAKVAAGADLEIDPIEDVEVAEDAEVAEDIVEDDAAEEDDLIEDTSELGEDDDDMSEVMEHLEDDEER